MEKAARRRYTLEYTREAVRLVESGQSIAAAAKALGIVEQTLANWVKADKAGQLRGLRSEQLSAEADGEHPPAGGAGASDDGARHPATPRTKTCRRGPRPAPQQA